MRTRGLVHPLGGRPFEVHVADGTTHWIGAECACRPTPSTVQGFAGVLHAAQPSGGFFEAQACLEHELHNPSPSPVGVAAAEPCEAGPNPVARHSERSAMAFAMKAFDDRGLVTVVAPSNLGSNDG